MSITRDRGKVVFECDDCGECLDTHEGDFEEALKVFREEGWSARKIEEAAVTVWIHRCHICAG